MISEQDVRESLQSVIDPEIGLDIVALGLVERVEIDEAGVHLGLIMTTPVCPQSELLASQARQAVRQAMGGEGTVEVEILESPFWTPDRMSDSARQLLNWR